MPDRNMIFACEAILGFSRCDLGRVVPPCTFWVSKATGSKDVKTRILITITSSLVWLSDSATGAEPLYRLRPDLHVSPG